MVSQLALLTEAMRGEMDAIKLQLYPALKWR